uniref:Uncharacterized protein n=1 Tax=Ixodes scapularis TaxID=6945 RepID=A0A4D5RF69_IXOSC
MFLLNSLFPPFSYKIILFYGAQLVVAFIFIKVKLRTFGVCLRGEINSFGCKHYRVIKDNCMVAVVTLHNPRLYRFGERYRERDIFLLSRGCISQSLQFRHDGGSRRDVAQGAISVLAHRLCSPRRSDRIFASATKW